MPLKRKIYTIVTRFAIYLFNKHLYSINTISGTVLMSSGDVLQQNIELYRGISDKFDWTRTGRISIVGTILGTLQHFFYCQLDKQYPGKEMRIIARKIILDQVLCTPVNIFIFIYGLGLLENNTWTEINKELKEKFTTIFLVDCGVFIPTQYINFKFVDPNYRLIFINAVSIIYDTFLSYMKYSHNKIQTTDQQEQT
ncbi:mpv17-like protein 2 isoform X2 [Daktulosphaira vitifoliae]|uniref:mpv17-like protein 2 isoform X2 n=1 Tax=Daktulosphaira vitifoliae TaxID=58002 RepID=UPI0021AA531A|nr:mpv17-like protein 2 isoform X2 [Daktulosphaira vitifoliae]